MPNHLFPRQLRRAVVWVAMLVLVAAAPAAAKTRTINFDDATTAPCSFSQTTPLTNRYTASLGVTFAGPAAAQGGAILDECGAFGVSGYSAPKFLAFNLTAGYPQPPETITFANAIHSFEIKAGQNGSGGTFTITGYDGNTPVSVNSRNSTAALTVLTLAATRMTKVKLEYSPGTVPYMIFDDLKFGTAPISGNESYEVTQGQTLTVPAPGVLANDTDPDADALTAAVSRGANNGTVTLRPDGSFTYTPGSGFAGTDSFAYRASDGTGTGNEATVTIKVNPLPPPPPPPPPPTPPTRILGITMPFFVKKSTKKYTVFTQLDVKGIPSGSTLKVTCKAPKKKKCPAKSYTKRNAKGKVSLKKWLKKRLPAGTKLTATVTKTGNFIGAVKVMTVKKRARPSFVDRCLPPGAKKPTKC